MARSDVGISILLSPEMVLYICPAALLLPLLLTDPIFKGNSFEKYVLRKAKNYF